MSNVQHPAHYGGDTTYEAIKVIEAWGLGFHLGNAVKYISRAGKKGDRLEDLRKAAWYIEREIARLTAPDVTGEAGGASEDPGAAETGSEAAQKVLRVGARVRARHFTHYTGTVRGKSRENDDYWDISWDDPATNMFDTVHTDTLEVIG